MDDMTIINAADLRTLQLGRAGEENATEVIFDCTAWVEQYGSGNFTLLHQRPGDPDALPVEITAADGVVTWVVTEGDTARSGVGEAQLIFSQSGAVRKSRIWATEILHSLTPGTLDPEPWHYVDRIQAAALAATEAAAGADLYKDEAEAAAAAAAGSADTAAETVRTAAAQAVADAEAAAATAQEKAAAAQAAQTAAETAQAAAEGAASTAALEATAAGTAQTAAETAQTAAETAQTAAESAASAADDAKDAAVTAKEAAEDASAEAVPAATEALASAEAAAASALAASGSASTAAGAKTAAQAAQAAAETAAQTAETQAAEVETAKTAAEAAQAAAELAESVVAVSTAAAEEAKNAAVAAKNDAVTAMEDATGAKLAAEDAAEVAGAAALAASGSATSAASAETAAETAQAAAEAAQSAAESAQSGAEAAQAAAELAETGAETAKTGAENAKAEAITAKNDAVTAKNAAEAAQTAAGASEYNARVSEQNAGGYQNRAMAAAAEAERSASSAQTAQAAASTAQTRAEAARNEALLFSEDASEEASRALVYKDAAEDAKEAAETAAAAAAQIVGIGVDPTLTVPGAAADSATVGDRIGEISESSENLWHGGDVKITANSGLKDIDITDHALPAGTYTITITNATTYTGSSTVTITLHTVGSGMTGGNRIATVSLNKNTRESVTFSLGSTAKGIRFEAGHDTATSSGKIATFRDIQIVAGDTAADTYEPYVTATDVVARGAILESTDDTTDRTTDILACLVQDGVCRLGPGDFYVRNLIMPNGSALYGCGDASKVYQIDGAVGVAIMMQNECTVADLTVLGASADIETGGVFAGMGGDIDELTNDIWDTGDITTGSESNPTLGYVQVMLNTPIPAGEYIVKALVTVLGDPQTGKSRMQFSVDDSLPIGGTTIAANLDLPVDEAGAGTAYTGYVSIPETVYSVRLCARESVSTSSGYKVKWSGIKMCALPSRSGIGWVKREDPRYSTEIERGLISNCRIRRFSCAGIYAANTGTAVFKNVLVTNTHVRNCNVGLYLRKNAEFNKISNCAFNGCQYAMISRCGNNGFNNCSFDSNTINMLFDNAEGENGGHSMVSNCTINHAGGDHDNPNYSLIIRSTEGGRINVTNCMFGFGRTLIENSQGNIISNCGYGRNAPVEVSGGGCSMFVNCFVLDTGASGTVFRRTNGNTAAKLINVLVRSSGNEIDWAVD